MIKSMTGFGRCEESDGVRRLTVEMKAVNHRYLDINLKMPKKLNIFEAAIRSLLKNYIQRGKVDIFFTYEDLSENKVSLKYNSDVAAEYLKYIRQMSNEFEINGEINAVTLSRYPEVIVMEEQSLDEEELWKLIEKTLTAAAKNLVEARIVEGENLKKDLNAKLDAMLKDVTYIEERSPDIIAEYRKKLEERVMELLNDSTIEESRIAAEVVLFADKICVDEEIVRLKSHISNTKDTLNAGGNMGRKLDFIAQEMNREANTILSKANDLEVSNRAINLKTEIEKIREQIQNIE
ncbi:YicC/YloC family endoribonuclease [Candidatus Galacturonibacter soehngenii]|uniref:YicC family protein n=1 Tax=Candidatus Galacturonatibacter soehngenii TaxID=2307010 RepID=A0A7V7QNN3_9FIRM|nr:YicC/YloC family endoribonuclease [Candidatus Galacturonibacter soehngenii]KAB1440666.1 YicC family protein [Candidatus Galacturonibacter soehngenii]